LFLSDKLTLTAECPLRTLAATGTNEAAAVPEPSMMRQNQFLSLGLLSSTVAGIAVFAGSQPAPECNQSIPSGWA
jgi:hypothetical protein